MAECSGAEPVRAQSADKFTRGWSAKDVRRSPVKQKVQTGSQRAHNTRKSRTRAPIRQKVLLQRNYMVDAGDDRMMTKVESNAQKVVTNLLVIEHSRNKEISITVVCTYGRLSEPGQKSSILPRYDGGASSGAHRHDQRYPASRDADKNRHQNVESSRAFIGGLRFSRRNVKPKLKHTTAYKQRSMPQSARVVHRQLPTKRQQPYIATQQQ